MRVVANQKTLEEALKEILRDDAKVTKYEAQVLKELILADGRVSNEEKSFLEKALSSNMFDDQALDMLNRFLLREEMKYRT